MVTNELSPIEHTIINEGPQIQNGFYCPAEAVHRGAAIDAKLYMLIGQRRIGKTTFFLWLACRLWEKYGIKTAWVRSRMEEWKQNYQSFLSEALDLGWQDPTWVVKTSGVFTGPERGAEKIISFVGLNTASNIRGGGHPQTFLMVLDEFQPEDKRYPPHCLQSLLSLTQTILSGKKGSVCFCLSNIISLANPYFVGLDIYPDRQQYSVFSDRGIVIERCRGYRCAIEKSNPWTKVYTAGRYKSYGSEEEDGLLDLVARIPKGCKPIDRVIWVLEGKMYQRMQTQDGKLIWYTRMKNVQGKNWQFITPYSEEITREIQLIPIRKYAAYILQELAAQRLRFDDPNTLFAVMSPAYDV